MAKAMTTLVRKACPAAGAVLLLVGCVTYDERALARMESADICEMALMQGRNLAPATRQAIAAEFGRRNDHCRNHAAETARRYEAFLAHEMYERHDDP